MNWRLSHSFATIILVLNLDKISPKQAGFHGESLRHQFRQQLKSLGKSKPRP